MRIRFPEHREDRKFFIGLCNGLAVLDGVREVEGRPSTGSVIIEYEGDGEALMTTARTSGLFEIVPEAPPTPPGVELKRLFGRAEASLKDFAGPNFSIGTVAGLAFVLMAMRQLARGQLMPPAATALWYGLSLLLREAGDEVRDGGQPTDGGMDPGSAAAGD